jgi:TolB-like protein
VEVSASSVPEHALTAVVASTAAEPATEPLALISPSPRLLRWLGFAGVLVALACMVVAIRSVANGSPGRSRIAAPLPKISSLAVIPLDNLSGSSSQDYLADGMTDELITMIAKNSTLRVISRTSVMQYKGVHRPLPEIAKALGVDGILEGSVARTGDRVHLNIQLIQAPSDTHVWAESYDRDASDIVSLPQEAAQTIARQLNSAVLRTAASPKYVNPEAHDAYLHGRYLWYQGVYPESATYFRKAIEIQPDYALGWSGLSAYYGATAADGLVNPREYLSQGEAAAIKAVQLDDSLAEAHLSLGAIYLFYHWDFARADQEILRAMELDPSFDEAPHFRAKILGALNRHQEAIAEQKKAMALNAFTRPWALGYAYLLARQYDNAILECQQRLVSLPHQNGLYWILAEAYRCKGMQKESVEMSLRVMEEGGDKIDTAKLRSAYKRGGYRATLLDSLEYFKRESLKHYVSPVLEAKETAQLGRREETLRLLEAAYRQHDTLLLWIQCDPAYDFLHSDERYRAIIRNVGLPPAY